MNDRFELVTIGGGTAALIASLGVAGLGGRTALIERDRVGGDCLWTGCVSSGGAHRHRVPSGDAPVPGLLAADPLRSDTVWALDELPPRLVILGGGAIGCELGQAFARLGSSVTIVEAMPTLLPAEVADVGLFLAEHLRSGPRPGRCGRDRQRSDDRR